MLFVCGKRSWFPDVCMYALPAFTVFSLNKAFSWGRDLVFFRNFSRVLQGPLAICKRGSLCRVSAC